MISLVHPKALIDTVSFGSNVIIEMVQYTHVVK